MAIVKIIGKPFKDDSTGWTIVKNLDGTFRAWLSEPKGAIAITNGSTAAGYTSSDRIVPPVLPAGYAITFADAHVYTNSLVQTVGSSSGDWVWVLWSPVSTTPNVYVKWEVTGTWA